ncbi:hypothetical protein MMPV_002272 [Pyropia vietnamensis]
MEVDTAAALELSAAAADVSGVTLPPHLERIRSRVEVGLTRPTNTAGTYGANSYVPSGYDNSLSPALFSARLSMAVSICNDEELVFDMAGLDAPLVNALRRILLAEVPSVAIERVLIRNNTSIVHDEMLAHRLGLVPLRVDIAALEDVPPPADGEDPTKLPYTSANHVVLRLKVRCSDVPGAPADAPPTVRYKNAHVLSSALQWTPVGDQAAWLPNGVEPVHGDILLAKLRPGQEIDIEAHAIRGVGRVHAKWSPVATAFYRMLPEVTLRRPLAPAEASTLVSACPANVFDLEDVAGRASGGGFGVTVARPRACTMCRECIRLPELAGAVDLTRRREHFVFSVESSGVRAPVDLFRDALDVLVAKCQVVLDALDEVTGEGGGGGEEVAEFEEAGGDDDF